MLPITSMSHRGGHSRSSGFEVRERALWKEVGRIRVLRGNGSQASLECSVRRWRESKCVSVGH